MCVCAVCVPCTTCSISQFLSATNSFNWLLISIEHSWLFLCFCMTGSCFSATTTHTPHTYTDIATISFKLNFYFFIISTKIINVRLYACRTYMLGWVQKIANQTNIWPNVNISWYMRVLRLWPQALHSSRRTIIQEITRNASERAMPRDQQKPGASADLSILT